MKAIYKEPGKPARRIEVANELRALQDAVGGMLEAVTLPSRRAAVLCNEEGRLMGLPQNCVINGQWYVGPVLIVGVDLQAAAFTDLTEEVEIWEGIYHA